MIRMVEIIQLTVTNELTGLADSLDDLFFFIYTFQTL